MSELNTAHLRAILQYKEAITLLHQKVKLHTGQVILKQQLFEKKKKFIWVQCGRNFGKTTFDGYGAVRHGITVPNQRIYIFGPERQQMKEILWASRVLQDMIPEKYYLNGSEQDTFLSSDLRACLSNGSFIKVGGADNHTALRGAKGHMYFLDEFQDWKEDSWIALEPNLAAFDAPLVITWTPPDTECWQTRLLDYVKKQAALDPDGPYYYIERPTETNPLISKTWLEEKRKRLEEKGELSIWLREYMAIFIPGGHSAIFPMLHMRKPEVVRKRDYILRIIERDKRKLTWLCVADPGHSTCFAVLFMAINMYTGQVYILDEIYEKDRNYTSVSIIYPKAEAKKKELYDSDLWENVYDEAAAWFPVEVQATFGDVSFSPTNKSRNDKDAQISLIKDIILTPGKLLIAEECVHFLEEMETYVTDDNGKPIKKNDHLIDTFRYGLSAANYEIAESPLRTEEDIFSLSERRKTSIFDNINNNIISEYDYDFFNEG